MQLLSDVTRHRWCTITLTGVMAAGNVGDATFPSIVGLGLRNFPRDEHVRPCRNSRLELPVRAACTPRYFFNSIFCWTDKGHRAIEFFLYSLGQSARIGKSGLRTTFSDEP